jgi:putative aldouronate transport system permease protein
MQPSKYRRKWGFKQFKSELPFHIMLLPGLLFLIIFTYTPLPANILMAFQDFKPILSFEKSAMVGWANFEFVFKMPDFYRALRNTLLISFFKIILGILVPLTLALLINEVTKSWFKRTVQTAMFLPFFMSWAIFGGIIRELFSLTGAVNQIIEFLGFEAVYFLADNSLFRIILISTDIWKVMGYSTIIYLAAITGVDTSLYEAVAIDGGGKWKQVWHITIPTILPIIILMATLSIGNLLNAGFEQVFILYNPLVYEGGDIIDTFVYRLGMVNRQYSVSASIGLFKSVISLLLVSTAYYTAYKISDYRIF